jgi:hypothetical protein
LTVSHDSPVANLCSVAACAADGFKEFSTPQFDFPRVHIRSDRTRIPVGDLCTEQSRSSVFNNYGACHKRCRGVASLLS